MRQEEVWGLGAFSLQSPTEDPPLVCTGPIPDSSVAGTPGLGVGRAHSQRQPHLGHGGNACSRGLRTRPESETQGSLGVRAGLPGDCGACARLGA